MNLLQRDLSKFFFNLSGFYFISWLINIITISIVAFFHFRLDHKLIVIENWIIDFAWPLATFSKVVAFFLYLNFFSEYRIKTTFDHITSPRALKPKLESFLFCLVNLIFFIFFIKPGSYDNVLYSSSRLGVHFLSILTLFGIDLIVISLLEDRFNISDQNPLIKVGVVSSLSSLFFVFMFPFGGNLDSSIIYLLVVAYAHYFFYKSSFVSSFIFLCIVIVPTFVLFGLDPVWGNKYSLLKSSVESIQLYSFAFAVVFITFNFVNSLKGVSRD